jgi:hypothetical protein
MSRIRTPMEAAGRARRMRATALFVLAWSPAMVWAQLDLYGRPTLLFWAQYPLAVFGTFLAGLGTRWVAEFDPHGLGSRWPHWPR